MKIEENLLDLSLEWFINNFSSSVKVYRVDIKLRIVGSAYLVFPVDFRFTLGQIDIHKTLYIFISTYVLNSGQRRLHGNGVCDSLK